MENLGKLSFFEDLSDGELDCGTGTKPVVAPSITERANCRARNLRGICKDMVLPDDAMLDWFSASSKILLENHSLAQFQP